MTNQSESERIAVLEEAYKHLATKAELAQLKADIRSDLIAHQRETHREFNRVQQGQTAIAREVSDLQGEFRVVKWLLCTAVGMVIAQFGALWFGLLPLPA